MFLAAPKMVSFLTAGSLEKVTILGAARKIFWPFLFCVGFSSYKSIFDGQKTWIICEVKL